MTKTVDKDGWNWLGDDSLVPCVWMQAGLVAYKLCDRDLECQVCPLDVAMRGGERGRPQPVAVTAQASWTFPADRRYHERHLWTAPHEQRWRCGVDAFAAGLAPGITGVVLPVAGSRLQRGQVCAWLDVAGRLIPLSAPLDGAVVQVNPALGEQPATLVHDPYGEGWLFELVPDEPSSVELLLDAVHAAERAREQRVELRDRLLRLLQRHGGDSQRLAADGGELAVDLRTTLEARDARWLLKPYLG